MRRILLILSIAIISACAHTKVSSYKASTVAHATYSRPLILGRIDRLEHQEILEDAFVSKLTERGLTGLRGIDVIPPTESQSSENIAAAFTNSPADSLILVSLKEGTMKQQEFKVTVIDKGTGKAVWVGETSTTSLIDGVLDSLTLRSAFGSMAGRVLNQLATDRIFSE